MKKLAQLGVAAFALALGVTTAAYEFPVSDHSVREAYFLGSRKDQKTAEFLSQYVKRFPVPKTGPHIAQVELRTPYQQIVLRARNKPDGYNALQAREEHRAAADIVVVRVLILLTPTYPAHSPVYPIQVEPVVIRPDDFWRDFGYGLYQDDLIKPQKITGSPIYSSNEFGLPGLVGAEVFFEYKASDLVEAPADFVVVAPTRQRVEAQFDLAKLR